jgi:hypothetical protein
MESKLAKPEWLFPVAGHRIGVVVEQDPASVTGSDGSLIDLSSCSPPSVTFGGARFTSSKPLAFHQRFHCRLKHEASLLDVSTPATVRTLRKAEDCEEWIIGCAFLCGLPLKAFETSFKMGVLTRRNHARYAVLLAATAVWEGGPAATEVEIVDMGAGGFSWNGSTCPRRGQKTLLRVEEPGFRLELAGEVRWSQKLSKGYSVGCSFITSDAAPKAEQAIRYYRSVVSDDSLWTTSQPAGEITESTLVR